MVITLDLVRDGSGLFSIQWRNEHRCSTRATRGRERRSARDGERSFCTLGRASRRERPGCAQGRSALPVTLRFSSRSGLVRPPSSASQGEGAAACGILSPPVAGGETAIRCRGPCSRQNMALAVHEAPCAGRQKVARHAPEHDRSDTPDEARLQDDAGPVGHLVLPRVEERLTFRVHHRW